MALGVMREDLLIVGGVEMKSRMLRGIAEGPVFRNIMNEQEEPNKYDA